MQLRKDGGSIQDARYEPRLRNYIRDSDGKSRAMMLQHEKGAQLILKDGKGSTFYARVKV